ncbi:MAG TPA: PIG-L family deacetylase [Gemmatimonadaceae bacterium]
MFLLGAAVWAGQPLHAQARGAESLGATIQGLGNTMRVLMIGAHPDDEDTQVIAWLSRGRHVETAYLSLTRGDGGQNAIGNELGEALGVIRTEELLAARRVDGGRQYFTRAYDYGFSKNAEEAFTQWPRDALRNDVLTVVRAFRPHVIISVFSGTPRDGHGQHQAAGILAREAYDFAADTMRVPRSATAGHGAWTVLKFYRGASFRRENATFSFNVGEYDPLLGRSYAEIAAISRSQHRSQAFGTLQPLGTRLDYLQREDSRVPAPADAKAEQSLFDGIDTTWARFRGAVTGADARAALDSLPAAFRAARASFNAFEPDRSIPALARIKSLLDRVCPTPRGGPPCARVSGNFSEITDAGLSVALASGRVSEALALAAGVVVEATLPRELWGVGQPLPVRPTVFNRGTRPVSVTGATLRVGNRISEATITAVTVPSDSSVTVDMFDGNWAHDRFQEVTAPYWLARPRQGAMFDFPVLGFDEASYGPAASVTLQLVIDGIGFAVNAPVVRRYADQVMGEVRRPVAGVPPISVRLEHAIHYAPARAPIERTLRVQLQNPDSAPRTVRLEARLPAGLTVDSATRSIMVPGSNAVRTVEFNVRGTLPVGRHTIDVVASDSNGTYAQGYTTIDYEHINPRRLYRPSRLTIEAVDLVVGSPMRIGYVEGVGDNSAPALEHLGLDITMLDPAQLATADLRGYSAIVVGPRAYEASPELVANNARLLDYARNGGTLVVQYGQYEMQRPGMMPYPITINRPHDRVTVEDVPVTILDSTSAVLSGPNRITSRDFEGWIQDRSLYMPRTFDPAYTPLLAMNDPGEEPRRGALLVAPLGRGTYVYTTLAFFRQLPNGVPGAARLFVNLLSAKAARPAQ